MNIIDSNRLLTDHRYRTLLYEYHSLIAYIANDLNRFNNITSAGVTFHETSDLFELKDEFIQMLKDTFPLFEIIFETNGEHYALDKDEYNISVSWQKYRKTMS